MMYKKPQIKYTDMAIYIDKHAYDENPSEEVNNLIFEYLYHICQMLAYKARYFQKYRQYEDFALYMATDVFMRLKNPKQFIYDNEGNPKLRKIKSILNYIKKVLYAKKVDFEQKTYDQSFSDSSLNLDSGLGYTFIDSLIDSIDDLERIDFKICLESIPKTLNNFFNNLQFNDKKLLLNLYLSSLLTFINQITPYNSDIQRIHSLQLTPDKKIELYQNLYKRLSLDDVILFDLDLQYKKLVFVLTNEVKHLLANDLSMITNNAISSESNLKSILVNDIINKTINNKEE